MYQKKYLKYKNKYISLKTQLGSATNVNDVRPDCSICYETIQITDNVTRCINSHSFHRHCIAAWCSSNPRCPCPYCNDNTGYIPPDVRFICEICSNPIEKRDLTKCGRNRNNEGRAHYFHRNCITALCISTPECPCPICRDDTGYIPPVVIPPVVRPPVLRRSVIRPPVVIRPDIRSLNRTNLLQTFQNLPDFENIYLSRNQIENIDPQTFQNLPNLQQINLNNNRIQNIDPQTFQNLPALRRIHLTNNQIQNIDPQTFQNLPNLRIICLDNNLIQNIDILRNQYPNIRFSHIFF